MFQKRNPKTRVLIIGAGPTGLMMACQLSGFNVPFRIVDQKKSPSVHSGAMVIHARSLEIFHQMGLADKMIEKGTVVNAVSVYFNGKKSGRLPLYTTGKSLSPFPFILLLKQSDTEHLLMDYLRQRGHSVEWSTELLEISFQDQAVVADLMVQNGRESVATDYLIAADGGKSSIRQFLRIPFNGRTHKTPLAIMECDTDIISPPDELLFSFSKQATFGFFPLRDGKWRIDAAFRGVRKRQPLSFHLVQKDFNRKSNLNGNLRNPEWFSVFNAHGKHAAFFRQGRCFLAGDAAHLVTPVGGQGMNLGLQDAQNLAWKMAMVIQGHLKNHVLNTYQEERKPVAIQVCNASNRLFKMAVSGYLPFKLFRNYFLFYVLRLFFWMMSLQRFSNSVFMKVSGIGFTYPLNLLNKDASEAILPKAPRPGQRVPNISYSDEKGQVSYIHEKMDGTRFMLLIFGGNSASTDKLLELAGRYQDVMFVLVLPFISGSQDLYIRFGIRSHGWYLIRPDLYIACRSDEYGAEKLREYLQEVFKRNKDERKIGE